MSPVIAALISGLLLYLSQGLNDAWPLAWIAPAPLLWLAYGRVPVWQLIAATAFAFLCGQIYVLQCYLMLPPVALLSVEIPLLGLFVLAVLFARWVARTTGPWATLLAFPAVVTATEFLYGSFAPNGSLGALAYTQMSSPLLIQSASLFGLAAVTFLLCLFANTLAMAGREGLRPPAVIATGLIVTAVNIVFGLARLNAPAGDKLTVAALDDDSLAGVAFDHGPPEASQAVAALYAKAARAVAAKGARLIVTPEGGIGATAATRAMVLAPLVAAAHDTGADIVVGIYDPARPADLALLLRADGTTQSYDKRHLVPGLENAFTPGRSSGWTGGGRAMEICKDMDFAPTIRGDAAQGIRVVAVPAGDFGRDGWLHGRIAVMRGVENGFAVVRAAHKGLLTISDAQGRLVAKAADSPTAMSTLAATVALGSGPTLYTRIGDVFAWLTVLATLAVGALAMFGPSRRAQVPQA